MPASRTSWLSGPPFAHRGLHAPGPERPENSMAAFRAAIAGGYGIELDIQLSADLVPIVFHDKDLSRLAGRSERISALTAAELAEVTLAGGSERIPTLTAALEALPGDTRLLVEVKAGTVEVEACASAVAALLGNGYPQTAVMSFHPGIIAWLEERDPARCRGQVASDPSRYGPDYTAEELSLLMAALKRQVGRPDFLAYDIRHLPAPLTEAYRSAGRPVLTWTVRSPEEHRRGDAHADNLIFEEVA